jgi:hypothetical protein
VDEMKEYIAKTEEQMRRYSDDFDNEGEEKKGKREKHKKEK